MKRYFYYNLLFKFTLAFAILLPYSNISVKSAEGSTFTTVFDQDNQTYRWDGSLLYEYSSRGKLSFSLDSKLQSTLIKRSLLVGGNNQWQEDGKAKASILYSFNPRLGISVDFSEAYNVLGNQKILQSEIIGVSKYKPNQWLSLDYGLGGAVSTRRGQMGKKRDRGINMSWNGILNPKILNADIFRITLNIDEEIYRNIPSNSISLSGFFLKSFQSGDSISFNYSGTSGKKKFYSSSYTLAGINNQEKNEHNFEGTIVKNLPLNFEIEASSEILFNSYRYRANDTSAVIGDVSNRDNSRLSEDYYLKLKRNFKIFNMPIDTYASYRTSGYNENFAQDERDENSAYGELGGGFSIALTNHDSVSTDFFTSVRSFYHPAQYSHQNDRDVESEILNMNYLRIWSKYLMTRTHFNYRNFHQIYIYKEASADNNRNYTYLFAPEIIWIVSNWITVNQYFEIQANYITYDYEKNILSSRNRIFRRSYSRTEMAISVSDNLKTHIEYGYRYEDYGQLIFDEQWKQLTSWDRRNNLGGVGFDYYPSKQLKISPEYSFEYKREWTHSEEESITSADTTFTKLRVLSDRQDQRIISLELNYEFAELQNLTFLIQRRIINGWRRGHIRDDIFTVSLRRFF